MQNKKIIIFDMDGTLLDSSASITKSINHVRETLGLPSFSIEKIVNLINEPDLNLPQLFYENKKPYRECKSIFEKHYYKNCIIDMNIYDGIKDLLGYLKEKYLLCIVTNAYSLYCEKMLKHLDIYQYFTIILGADDVNRAKPDPFMINSIIKKLNIQKKYAVMIGDSIKDEQAAQNANIRYIYVDWGFGECINPDIIFSKDDLLDIKKIEKLISNLID